MVIIVIMVITGIYCNNGNNSSNNGNNGNSNSNNGNNGNSNSNNGNNGSYPVFSQSPSFPNEPASACGSSRPKAETASTPEPSKQPARVANGWKGTKDVEKTWEKWWKVKENWWKIGWKMKVVWKSHEQIKYNQVKRRKKWWNMMKRMKNGNWNRLEHVEAAEIILQILQMLRPKRLEEMVWSNQRLKQRTVGCISKNGDLFLGFAAKIGIWTTEMTCWLVVQ